MPTEVVQAPHLWTPETAPRNGGRPKGVRDKISTRILEATRAFLEGDETHEAFDLSVWLKGLATSGNPSDNATLARFLLQFVPTDVRIDAHITSHAQLTAEAGKVPREVLELYAQIRERERIERDARVIDVEPVKLVANGAPVAQDSGTSLEPSDAPRADP